MTERTSSIPAARPRSDVSSAVGFVGVATLVAWVMFARHYPEIAPALGLDASLGRLSGPYAALTSVALCAATMALWSIFVDKVHRNPSTGIDWSHKRLLADVIDVSITKLAGLWATFGILAAFYCIGRWYWEDSYLFAMEVLSMAVVPLVVLSIPYVLWLDRYMVNPRDACWHFGAMLIGREPWDIEQVKKHARAWFIKGFFTAFMLSIIPFGFEYAVQADFAAIMGNPVEIGVALFELLFLIDVQIGTVGYLITFRPLDSHIRSGNPFLAGWLAALLCYPPFVWGAMGDPGTFADGGAGILAYKFYTSEWYYWLDGYEALLWGWAALLALLTAYYAWATMIFGLRFSNLTYRGIITNGPYRYTRHPAYISKNTFWWLSTMPFFVTNGSLTEVVRNTVFLGCISAIYYWRAKTEEAHLLLEDEKYRDYHAWMGQHGLITAPLEKFKTLLSRRVRPSPTPHPAE